MTNDPKILVLAVLGGIIPSFIWLWFWLNECQKKSEPPKLLALCFIVGMIGVLFVWPIEKFILDHVDSHNLQIILWASTEEIIKFLAVMLVVYRTNFCNKPIDWPIFFMTTALGFAAMENELFIFKTPLDQTTMTLITERFLGAILLHAVSSGIIGISIGLSFYMEKWKKYVYVFVALVSAITLHSAFNFFILNKGSSILNVFGFLWVVTIIIMILFEKVRRMSGEN